MQTMKEASSPGDEERYVRRLQLTGRGSYIVSVPKEWVHEIGLRKGGEVELRRQQDHSLLLAGFGKIKTEIEQTRCSLTVPSDIDPGTLTRRLLSLYLIGYTTIEIMSKSGNLSGTVRDRIRDVAVGRWVGKEVVTESSKRAILKRLLSPRKLWSPVAL